MSARVLILLPPRIVRDLEWRIWLAVQNWNRRERDAQLPCDCEAS